MTMRAFVKRFKNVPNSLTDDPSRTTTAQPESKPRPGPPPLADDSTVFPHGVKVLYQPVDVAPDTDVCFIHGLCGNRESTWAATGHKQSWPEKLLPGKLPNARILTLGFNADIIKKPKRGYEPSSNRLNNHARACLLDLVNDRDDSDALLRPIIFVVHSIGGLICKKMILLSQNHPDSEFRSTFESLRGVIFLGTPHQGSWLADLGRVPLSALGVFKSISVSLLDILETDNETLEDLQKEFLTMLREQRESNRKIKVVCFYEELASYGRFMIVPRNSAVLESYEHYGMLANHRDMVKYGSAEDNGFKRVSSLLKRWQSAKEFELHRDTSSPEAVVRATGVTGGDGAHQIFGGANVVAENIYGGNGAFQLFGTMDPSTLNILRQASTEPSYEGDRDRDEEQEVVTVSSGSSTIR